VPAIASASATHASFPDWTIMPLISSSTATGLFGSMNMREPSLFHARVETGTTWSVFSVFCLSALKVRYAVMSFVSEAGSMRWFGFCPTSCCPLLKSVST
jgi:hypothetical protein